MKKSKVFQLVGHALRRNADNHYTTEHTQVDIIIIIITGIFKVALAATPPQSEIDLGTTVDVKICIVIEKHR